MVELGYFGFQSRWNCSVGRGPAGPTGSVRLETIKNEVPGMMKNALVSVIVASLFAASSAVFSAEQVAVLVSFDAQEIGPSVSCGGSVSVDGGELTGLSPVMFEPGEEIEEKRWQCQTFGTLDKPGGRSRVFQISRHKGILARLRGGAATVLQLTTDLGSATVRIGDLRQEAQRLLDGRVLVTLGAPPQRLTTDLTQDDFPDVTVAGDGTVWAGWQAWDDEGDRLRVARHADGAWSEPEDLPVERGDVFRLTLASANTAGAIWGVWSQNRAENWDLWACRWESGEWGKPIRLTQGEGADFNQTLAVLPDNTVMVAWQRCVDGKQYDICLGELGAGGLTDVLDVTEHPANDWEPQLAVGRDGSLAVLWDTYRNGSYDIYLRRRAPNGTFGPSEAVACSPRYEAHASACYDPQGRLWVAWDEAGENWGKHGKGSGIHVERRVKLACILEDGPHAPSVPLTTCRGSALSGIWELPQITMDGSGRPVVFFRHAAVITRWRTRNKEKERQSRGVWPYFATRFDGTAWSPPTLLLGSDGRNDQRVAIARTADGTIWTTYAGDDRRMERAEVPHNNNVWALPFSFPESNTPVVPGDLLPRAPEQLSEPGRSGHSVTLRGTNYSLVYGDTHRHTDMSRCGMMRDGSLIDTYRYAIDATALDFLGIADHDQDILKHRYDREQRPLQGYMWWRSEKFCDLFTMRPRFLAVYGYEHGGSLKSRGGHKNVMYSKRGNPCIEDDAPADLFRALEGRDAVAIPHQLADGGSATDWDRWDGRWEPVAEMFQARGSYEFMGAPRLARVQRRGHFVWDALAKGIKTGLIASSDHGLTHGAYACLYVRDRSREALIEAFRARRTFAATDTIVLEFSLGDAFMGEDIQIRQTPVLRAMVRGTSELARIDIVRNNEFIYSVSPDGSEYRFEFTDSQLSKGQKAYYYLRCVQDNRELAWSSPIWVEWGE